MAIVDIQATFSDEQAVTVTAFGTAWYDTSAQINDLAGNDMHIRFTVDEAALAAGAATVDFQLVEADDDAGTGVAILASSGAIGKAALTIGAEPFDIGLPSNNKRYVGVRYVVATGPLTAGKFSAMFVGSGGANQQRRYDTGYPSPYSG